MSRTRTVGLALLVTVAALVLAAMAPVPATTTPAVMTTAVVAAVATTPAATVSVATTTPATEAAPTPADWQWVPRASLPENAPARMLDGQAWIGANDLARLLDATKFWNATTRKLTLRVRTHRVQLTADNPFVVVDDGTVLLGDAVRSVNGELHAPVSLLDTLPHGDDLPRLVYDVRRGLVFRVPEEGLLRTPTLAVAGDETRLSFPVDGDDEVAVVGRARDRFRIRFRAFFVGSLPELDRRGSLLRDIRPIPSAFGSAFELTIDSTATGFHVRPEPGRSQVTLVLTRGAAPGFDAFAPDGDAETRPIRVIVLDPGHGGGDPGVVVQDAVEKDLALELAKTLKVELERRMHARVLLTRDGDRTLTVQERAEFANRNRADLVLSLHFDGAPTPGLRGATAWCPPATFATEGTGDAPRGTAPLQVLTWRDVATRHAVRSRQLAEALRSALELSGLGPARLRDVMPSTLLGINAPGLMLECAVLTSDADRARVTRAPGLPALATSIAAGVQAYASRR